MSLVPPSPGGWPRASLSQLQIHSLEKRLAGQPVANFPVALHLDGPLDAALLARSLNAVVARHDILRTHFETVDGHLVQVVAPTLNVPVPVIDLRLLPDGVREAHAYRLAQEEAARPFESGKLPLLRAQLYLFGDAKGILVLTMHRGIFDHDSLGILLRELAVCHEAFRHNRAPSLPAPARQYASPDAPGAAGHAEDAAWWREKLAGAPAGVRLPGDRPRNAHGARFEKRELPEVQRQAVESFARREGTDPIMVYLTVLAVLLHRYAGETELLFGLGVSNRAASGSADLPGPFNLIVPLRTSLDGDPVLSRLLARIRAEVQAVLAHPCGSAADPADHPAEFTEPAIGCPVWFVHERRPAELVRWPGLRVQELELSAGACTGELVFHLVEHGGHVGIRAEYDSAVFSPAFAQRLLGHYSVLLDACVTHPHFRISTLPMLTPPEQRRLFADWNNTRVDYPRDATVQELVAARCAANPGAIAVGPDLSYGDLELRSNQLGRHLRIHGVKPGTCVALCVNQAADLVVGIIGILKAGGIVLPLDPAVLAPLQARLLEEARADLVLTESALRPHLPDSRPQLLIDVEAGDIHRADDAVLVSVTGHDDPAWVACSTGTGGEPRAVEYSHRALISMLHATQQLVRLDPVDVLLGTAEFSTAAAITDLLLPLLFGARLELASPQDLIRPLQLATRTAVNKPTVMLAAPAVWRRLLETGWTGNPGLRLISRGEPLARELADRLLRCGSGLWNFYDTAETAGVCMAAAVATGRPATLEGRPVANVQVHLLDAHLQPVPVGLPGELFVGGDSLATGYRRATDGTARQFTADPFRRLPGARLFRTGDRARRLPGGEIELLGRVEPRTATLPQVAAASAKVAPPILTAPAAEAPDAPSEVAQPATKESDSREAQEIAVPVLRAATT
jgi:non-ribosomal peptide synthetase component F